MFTIQQKIIAGAIAASFTLQGVAVANLVLAGFGAANKADALLQIAKKHAENLDADDLKVLHNLNLMP